MEHLTVEVFGVSPTGIKMYKLTADEGYVIANVSDYSYVGTIAYLGIQDSVSNYCARPASDYNLE